MNILFLHSNNFYSINFLNNCIDMLYDLFDKLRNYGHTVKMLTVNDRIQKSEPEAFTYGSLKIIPKRLKYSFQNEILLLNNIIMLNNVESNISPTEKYDIIHCFDLESSICSKLLKDRFNAKLIFNFTDNFLDEKPGYQRNAKEKFRRYLSSWFLQFVDINIVHTYYNYERLQNIYLIDETMIKRMPYFNSLKCKQFTADRNNTLKFLLLTTFYYEKEIIASLKFISSIKREIKSVHLDLITNPDVSVFGKLLSKTIRSLNIAADINWMGGFNLKLRELLQKNISIILFPFQYHNFESLLFEATSLNLIIIYQPSIQNNEILTNYNFAYPFDFHSFTEENFKNLISFLNNQLLVESSPIIDINEHTTDNIKIYEEIYEQIFNTAVIN